MTQAGADVLVPHMGLTTERDDRRRIRRSSLDDAVGRVQEMRDAAVAVNPDVIVLCHGGPIAEPEDAAYVLAHTRGVAGFFGASSAERLPTERAIKAQIEQFKAIPLTERTRTTKGPP